MTNLSAEILPMSLEFEKLSPEAIPLSQSQINQAVELSSQVKDESLQWQTYLNTLSLSAFENWLDSRGNSFNVNQDECTILQPRFANLIPTVANLNVGEYKVCLITTGSFIDEQVDISRVVIDLPEYIPHFYVLVEVIEEEEKAVIQRFISYKELSSRQQSLNFKPNSDWNYEIPLTWFCHEPDRLLLYLNCLEPVAITLPVIPTNRVKNLELIKEELINQLPQLQTKELCEALTWEQASAVLTNPELIDWIYNLQTQTEDNLSIKNLQQHLSDIFKLITQPAINVGRWLWDELDDLAQTNWNLLPNITPQPVMRSPVEEFTVINSQLQQQGLEIPVQARGAYQDLSLAGVPLRLYAVTWHLLSETDPNSWTLLLVLGTPALESLPINLKLRVSDQTGILVEQKVNPELGNSYLFTRVVGNFDEKFLVSVSLGDGVEITLPFAFDMSR
ncbi:hypothetical protein NIES267_10760 [Calothrix parasitica NIES-267]|uniref:DUF1822 family protein n=1 Tax=Calothrix parasitica NIES-267 TaxID=1973488 RepID=A0A1Z4LK92_9CYAN|nr:hypothetical protein NIES267_10760 [Calothrix parasitica NIES-267]